MHALPPPRPCLSARSRWHKTDQAIPRFAWSTGPGSAGALAGPIVYVGRKDLTESARTANTATLPLSVIPLAQDRPCRRRFRWSASPGSAGALAGPIVYAGRKDLTEKCTHRQHRDPASQHDPVGTRQTMPSQVQMVDRPWERRRPRRPNRLRRSQRPDGECTHRQHRDAASQGDPVA